jgi:hypothetical protein
MIGVQKHVDEKGLECHNFKEPSSLKPMSIAMGIVGKTEITFVSDSQTTCDSVKKTNTQKVSSIQLGGERFLVAHAAIASMNTSFERRMALPLAQTAVNHSSHC